MEYTLADYGAAKSEVSGLSESWSNYMGGNTHKYETQLREARDKLREIEHCLLRLNVLEPTELQAANIALDDLYPYAKSKTRAVHMDKVYEIRYWKEPVSLSGKTTRLRHEWLPVEPDTAL